MLINRTRNENESGFPPQKTNNKIEIKKNKEQKIKEQKQ